MIVCSFSLKKSLLKYVVAYRLGGLLVAQLYAAAVDLYFLLTAFAFLINADVLGQIGLPIEKPDVEPNCA